MFYIGFFLGHVKPAKTLPRTKFTNRTAHAQASSFIDSQENRSDYSAESQEHRVCGSGLRRRTVGGLTLGHVWLDRVLS